MIANMRHRVILCRQSDIVTVGGDMRLAREGIWSAWAAIEQRRSSAFSPNGAAMRESRDQRSHAIKCRYRADLNVSAMAWIYEARQTSSPRWFKVLSVGQTEEKGTQMFIFDCRLVERGDDIDTPRSTGPATGLPDGVRL